MRERLVGLPGRFAVTVAVGVLVSACTPAAPLATVSPATSTVGSTPAPTVGSSPGIEPWAEDLAFLDERVRAIHKGPFTIHPESEWVARLVELRRTLPQTSDPDEQLVQLASLVGLLDTHTWINTPVADFYDLLVYPFSDGWFVIAAGDTSLVGSRLHSISGMSVDEVLDRFTPLVPHDNHSGLLDSVQGLLTSVEYLHGTGIVSDVARPAFGLERADGTTMTIDPDILQAQAWESSLGIVGGLIGPAPEAVRRRTEASWWRIDDVNKVFVWSYNDYVDPVPGLRAMTAALDSGEADRVVLDVRYLRGGNGGIAFPMVDGLVDEPRVNRDGGLTVLIGRENVSAGTIIDRMLEVRTQALFVGEPTPARPDGFLCECIDVTLPRSGVVVTLPSVWLHNGDTRSEIPPDIEMLLSSVDFFAGRDPVLDAAREGLEAPG